MNRDEHWTFPAVEGNVHDMVVPYLVIESARLGDRTRHVQRGGVNKSASQKELVYKVPDTHADDVHSIYLRSRSADGIL
jgi:hypothetical protein